MRTRIANAVGFSTVVLLAALAADCQPTNEISVGCSVQELIAAINTANADPGADTLVLAPSCTYTFTGFDNQDGGQGGNALPVVRTPVAISGRQATLERSSALGTVQFRAFLISADGALRLDDLTISDFYAILVPGEVDPGGGAIYNDGGSLTINRSTFDHNRILAGGGAILNKGALIIQENSLFTGNSATLGGAIYNTGDNDFPLTIANTELSANLAHSGGALYNSGPSTKLVFSAVVWRDNSAFDQGGAIFSDGGELSATDNLFINNRARHAADPEDCDGGAIYNHMGEISIYRTRFEMNHADARGGAIYNARGQVTLRDAITFWANHSDGDGGAIANETSGEVTVADAYFALNSADIFRGDGGAIFNAGTLSVARTSFFANWSEDGGGLFNEGQAKLVNTTFGRNQAREEGGNIANQTSLDLSFCTIAEGSGYVGQNIFNEGNSLRIENSIVYEDGNGPSCVDQSGSLTALGKNISNSPDCAGFYWIADPQLMSDADYGGHGWTYALMPTSPAVDVPGQCVDLDGLAVTEDGRGVARPQNGQCDLGAFERAWSDPLPPPAELLAPPDRETD